MMEDMCPWQESLDAYLDAVHRNLEASAAEHLMAVDAAAHPPPVEEVADSTFVEYIVPPVTALLPPPPPPLCAEHSFQRPMDAPTQFALTLIALLFLPPRRGQLPGRTRRSMSG